MGYMGRDDMEKALGVRWEIYSGKRKWKLSIKSEVSLCIYVSMHTHVCDSFLPFHPQAGPTW
jgi:hypothetical protein